MPEPRRSASRRARHTALYEPEELHEHEHGTADASDLGMKRTLIILTLPLLLAAGCSHTKDRIDAAIDPESGSEPTADVDREDDIEASALDPTDAYAEWAVPLFDGEGYYLVLDEIPVPVVTAAPDSGDLEEVAVAVFIEPALADLCDMDPSVDFKTNSHEVDTDDRHKLEALSGCLMQPPLDSTKITLTGYADPRGTKRYNRELGMERATAVEHALVADGMSDSRITVASMGEQFASNDPKDWASDRRVVVRLDD